MKKAIPLIAALIFAWQTVTCDGRSLSPNHPIASPESPQSTVTPYWTCPMHPQVHSGQSGECPICHMRLVQARGESLLEKQSKNDGERRANVSPSANQLKLIGIQKIAVETMDLEAKIPIAGRLLSPSKIAFQIYEEDLRYIKPGLFFWATSSFFPDAPIRGEITSVDNIADPTSRTIRVIGAIKEGPSGLIAETTFSGIVDVPLKGAIAIPESSVLRTGNADLVYLVQSDGTLKAKAVKLGQKTESYYEIREGLNPGQMISSGPNFLIDSEAKIDAASQGDEPGKSKIPVCPPGQHWDLSMTMCMPGDK